MPTYEYRCPECGQYASHFHAFDQSSTPHQCARCHMYPIDKIVSNFSIAAPMQDHFNTAVNKPISSMRTLKAELNRKSEELTERTGIPHNYQPVDLRDKEGLGVTDEGLDSTYARQTATGEREV